MQQRFINAEVKFGYKCTENRSQGYTYNRDLWRNPSPLRPPPPAVNEFVGPSAGSSSLSSSKATIETFSPKFDFLHLTATGYQTLSKPSAADTNWRKTHRTDLFKHASCSRVERITAERKTRCQADEADSMLEMCCAPVRSAVVGLVLMLMLCWCAPVDGSNVVIQRDAQFDVTYYDTVTSDNQTIYSYNHTVSRNKTEGVRVSVELLSESVQSPLLFVVRQKQAVLSFQVPLILRGLYQRKYQYTQVGRTLCQPPTKAVSEMQFFYVDVSTLSSAGVHYQLRVSRVDSFNLLTDKKFCFNATPSQPQFFKYVFPDGVDTVIVKINSQKNFPCSVMSIQDIQCPVFDLDNNVAFIGMYQTMTTTAAITVQGYGYGQRERKSRVKYFCTQPVENHNNHNPTTAHERHEISLMSQLFLLDVKEITWRANGNFKSQIFLLRKRVRNVSVIYCLRRDVNNSSDSSRLRSKVNISEDLK
ncbi:putative SID1 transmembrane family member 2 [Triplophysa rosa]|uniref:SID1 transmembrane family member 2 n=1 Tax=Triplophysa rosa TaxID=992332 RepID=A0A9W7TPS3_TRIRA|nr:putative SID1 transmembrane family member 2 [Triplophysa rosa]